MNVKVPDGRVNIVLTPQGVDHVSLLAKTPEGYEESRKLADRIDDELRALHRRLEVQGQDDR